VPEGDTILRAARTLNRALAGRRVAAARAPMLPSAGETLAGRTVSGVSARGKNLLVHFDDGSALRTHMRMTGSWHLYRPGERWRKPGAHARIVLETDAWVAVCFAAPVVELLAPGGAERHEALTSLGPDILGEEFDYDAAVRRLQGLGDTPLGEAVLAQCAVAGIGNIYKSETLFLMREDPFAPVGAVDERRLKRVLARARELMRAALGSTPRATRPTMLRSRDPGVRTWVYRREGRPCRRCGTEIRMRRQGVDRRSTYWCPKCQATREV
jgi:endonuclease VIII